MLLKQAFLSEMVQVSLLCLRLQQVSRAVFLHFLDFGALASCASALVVLPPGQSKLGMGLMACKC